MPYVKDSWVWVKFANYKRLALLSFVREHVVVLRFLNEEKNQLSLFRESVSKRLLEPAELTPEQLASLPCGKRILNLGRAKQLVAVNRIFTDNTNRKERRIYYCRRCRGFHTTAQFKLPIEFLKTLAANPYEPQGIENYNSVSNRKRVWRWWHDILGIPVSFGLFERSLKNYGITPAEATHKILIDPLQYMHYLLETIYRLRKITKRNQAADPMGLDRA